MEYHGKTKNAKELTKDDLKPPDDWIWKDTEWKIDKNRAVDREGKYVCMCVCMCVCWRRMDWQIKSIRCIKLMSTTSWLPSLFSSLQDGSTVLGQTLRYGYHTRGTLTYIAAGVGCVVARGSLTLR